MAKDVFFRCDASPQIGAGHVMRCLALAETIAGMGFAPHFVSIADSRRVLSALLQSGFPIVQLRGDESGVAAAQAAGMDATSLVVIDHYGLGYETERQFAAVVEAVIVFDDFPNRRHAASVLLDPTPGRAASDYEGLLAPETRVFAGSNYALVRPLWTAARRVRGAATSEGLRIVVSMGATDPANATARIVDALKGIDADVDVVLGASAPYLAEVRSSLGLRMTLQIDPPNMAALFVRATMAIGALGSSSFERALLGVPSIAIPVADNQSDVAAALAKTGAAEVLPLAILRDPAALRERVLALAKDPKRRQAMAQAAMALCDGRGARRLLAALAGEVVTTKGGKVRLRLAEAADCDWLLALQSRPQTRRFARNSAVPAPAEHHAWYRNTIEDPDRILCIVESDGSRSGFIRLDRKPVGEKLRFEISIAIDPDFYGQGIGAAALVLARRLAPGAELDASVMTANTASQSLFVRAGYRPIGHELYRSLPQ